MAVNVACCKYLCELTYANWAAVLLLLHVSESTSQVASVACIYFYGNELKMTPFLSS